MQTQYLEPNGGNFYKPHNVMLPDSGRFWRCKHGNTGFNKDLEVVGCEKCAANE